MVATVAIPRLSGEAIDAIQANDRSKLKTIALLIAIAASVRLVITVARRLVAGRVSLAVEFDLRELIYNHLNRLELSFFDKQQTGQLMSRATVDLQAVRFFLGYGLVFITQSLLTIALASIAMFLIDPTLALLALIPTPLVVVVATRYGLVSRPALQEVQQRLAELTADAEQNVSGVRIVRAFAREEHQQRRFEHQVKRVFNQAIFTTHLRAFYNPLIGFFPMLGLAVVLIVGGRAVVDGSITTGEFSAFYIYQLMLAAPMRQLGSALGMSQRAIASGRRIFEITDREPAMVDSPEAQELPSGNGAIRFKNVSLQYGSEQAPTLRDIDLEITAGSTVAVVGETGCGKTSLISLLPRLYDVSSGSISIDGVDIRSVQLASLRSQIGLVTSDPFLFSTTVADNIAYGHPNASKAQIREAARQAQADRFIEELPEGYQTVVGERGLTLSGGQRQRLAIARALVGDPRILILDDATSAVDAETGRVIDAELRKLMQGKTTLIVSYRLSMISAADRVVLLKDGKIAEDGDPTELLNRSTELREALGVTTVGAAQ